MKVKNGLPKKYQIGIAIFCVLFIALGVVILMQVFRSPVVKEPETGLPLITEEAVRDLPIMPDYDPEIDTAPSPDPISEPEPAHEPEPAPETAPEPEPELAHEPETAPEPEPELAHEPETAPEPEPTPVQEPTPTPDAEPKPESERVAMLPAAVVEPEPEPVIDDGFIFVRGGVFRQGSDTGDDDEKPVHTVKLSSFYISPAMVTQEEWRQLKGERISYQQGDDLPMENIGWHEAIAYCNRLSNEAGLTPAYEIDGNKVVWDRNADGYRLPTEAEWEYAALGGQFHRGYHYAGSDDPDEVAWYRENAGGRAHPVSQKKPNELGLYDMSGNLWEWVWDWYGPYDSVDKQDPAGPEKGDYRVLKGGFWYTSERTLRPSARYSFLPAGRASYIGFRVVRAPHQ